MITRWVLQKIKFLIMLVIVFAIVMPVSSSSFSMDVDSHLSEFEKYNSLHHDNIDDTAEEHSHVHKHSEDGEEHEHNHDHSKISEVTSKTLYFSTQMTFYFVNREDSSPSGVSDLISDPHLSEIFKPPRA